MPKLFELTCRQKIEIHTLRYKADWSVPKIAKHFAVHETTIYRNIKEPLTPTSRKPGRKLKITTPIRLQLIQAASQDAEHRCMPLFDVAQEIGLDVCKETVTTAMAKAGYNRRVARRKPFLTLDKKQRRLQFARRHQSWRLEWDNVLFTDECYIRLTGLSRRIWVTRTADEEFLACNNLNVEVSVPSSQLRYDG